MTEEVKRSNAAHFGLVTLAALVVANMVGAGIFTSSGFALAALEHPNRVMFAWFVCGIWAVCGAISYGSLVKKLPISGGEYLFLSRLVHPAVGFLAGWISCVSGFTAPIAAAALTGALYAMDKTSSDIQVQLLAASMIVVATVCHLGGLRLGTWVQNLIVILKMLLLAALLIWALGFAYQGFHSPPLSTLTSAGEFLPTTWGGWTTFTGAMSWIALSYTGFNAAIYVASEAKQATKIVPSAMLIATLMVTLLYLLLNVLYLYAPAPELIRGNEQVALISTRALAGESSWVLVALRGTIVLAMLSSVFAMILAGPRVYQKMAEDGVMPKILGSSGNPRAAIVVQATLSIAVLFIANLQQLLQYLGLTLSACGALAIAGLLWAKWRLPESPSLKPWEWTAVFGYLVITACIVVASRTEHPIAFVAMLITFAVGAIVYAIWISGIFHSRSSTQISTNDE